MTRTTTTSCLALAMGAMAVGCGGDDDSGEPSAPPETYTFESRFTAGESSVSYSGQTARHVLIHDLTAHIVGLTERLDQGTLTPTTGDVVAELSFYFDFDSATAGDLEHGLSTSPPPLQETYDGISANKDLVGKVAGNDPVGQYRDWSSVGTIGAPGDDPMSPEQLVRHWFDRIDAMAVARANGDVPLDPTGAPIENVYVTPEGLDLRQLVQKFLDGAVGYSQGADDYLDDDTEGKGLLSDNTAADGDAAYTPLEHQWDEGFGYFGATRDYALHSDDEIADDVYWDIDGDGRIDLTAEYNFGHSTNAAKRDRGAQAPTDITKEAIEGFIRGRHIIATADGALTDEQMADLKAARDQALLGWEKAIAATALHYVNDTLQDMAKFGTAEYSFSDHAKHWSELKGFALALQFNPRASLSVTEQERLHDLIGDAPALPGDPEVDTYKNALIEARSLLGDAYGFADANLGDENGENGW